MNLVDVGKSDVESGQEGPRGEGGEAAAARGEQDDDWKRLHQKADKSHDQRSETEGRE